MGQWKKKSGERLRDVCITLKRDMKWVSRFIELAAEKHGRTPGDLFRHAFCKHFAGRPDDGFVGGISAVEKTNWDRIPFKIPDRMSWMSEAVEDEMEKRQCSAAMLFFIAFCEVYGEEFPELKELFAKWREVNLQVA